MATVFPFKINGLEKILALFDQLPKRVQRELYNELKITAAEIRDAAKKAAPKDEAQLIRSITSKEVSKTEFDVVAQSLHAGYMEFGTKSSAVIPAGLESIAAGLKGPGGGTGNPIDALEAWVKRKGVAGRFSTKTRRRLGSATTKDSENRQAAFLIWRKIKKRGLRPRSYFYKQVAPAETKLKQRIANIIQQII